MAQEYKALVKYQGGETTYTFPFLYLRKKFVKVRYQKPDGTFENLEYAKDYNVEELKVKLEGAGSSEDNIIIYRQTPTDMLIDYVDATILKAYDLNVNQIQLLHILEEQQDRTLGYATGEFVFDAYDQRIQNVADPVNDKDAVNKQWFLQELYKRALCLDENMEHWDAEGRRIMKVANPYAGQDAVTLNYLMSYAPKIIGDAILDDFFEIDVNGGLMPTENPTYARKWVLDANGDIMPKESEVSA